MFSTLSYMFIHFKCTLKCRLQFASIWTSLKKTCFYMFAVQIFKSSMEKREWFKTSNFSSSNRVFYPLRHFPPSPSNFKSSSLNPLSLEESKTYHLGKSSKKSYWYSNGLKYVNPSRKQNRKLPSPPPPPPYPFTT